MVNLAFLILNLLIVSSNGQLSLPFDIFNDLNSHLQNEKLRNLSIECGFFCDADDLGPPPDFLLIKPPPLPPSLQKKLLASQNEIELDENEDGNYALERKANKYDQNEEMFNEIKDNFNEKKTCQFCNLFYKPNGKAEDFMIPNPDLKAEESWLSFLLITIGGSIISCFLLILFVFKCKKWKIFPVSDSCPILPESFLGGHKSAPPPCSPSDPCISPVVNEKPQSVITNSPTKKTSIPSKYWRRTNDLSHGGRQIMSVLDKTTTELDEYSGCTDEPSCTSSPVYAELDAININCQNIPEALITGPSQSISPYAVHTYSEVADAMRMAALGTSATALLPDASYDNAAYLPSSNSDQYHGRSLRKHHRALAQLSCATPLLPSSNIAQCTLNGSLPINYLSGRPMKKPRPSYAHQHAKSNLFRTHEPMIETMHGRQYLNSRRHNDNLYGDLPLNTSNLTTFRLANIPYANGGRDQPKRPLPPVPGVRL